MIKKILFIVTTLIVFFSLSDAKAFTSTNCGGINKKDYSGIECSYKSADGNYSAVTAATIDNCNGPFEIKYVVSYKDGNVIKKKTISAEGDNYNLHELTNECPSFLSFYIGSMGKAHVKVNEEFNNGVTLNLISTTEQQISSMKKIQEAHGYYGTKFYYFDSVYNKNRTGVEGKYNCKYNNGQQVLEFTASYDSYLFSHTDPYSPVVSGVFAGEFISGNFTFGSKYYCPGNVYKVVSPNGTIGWKLHGNTYPSVCSVDGVTCTKYTKEAMVDHNDKNANSSEKLFEKSYTYKHRQYDLNSNNYVLDENDYISLSVSAKQKNGKTEFTSFDMRYNGSKIYLFADSVEIMREKISEEIFGAGDFPDYMYCFTNKDYKKLLSGNYVYGPIDNESPSSDYSGYYCSFETMVSEDLHKSGQSKVYIRTTLAPSEDSMTLYDKIQNIINKVNSNNYNEGELYNSTIKIYNTCQEFMSDLDNPDNTETYKACADFVEKKVPEWATAGRFGNRIVSSELADGCTETLGALGIWLTRIYKVLLMAVPVIIVAFGFKDFIQAMGAGKEDELKKVGSTFVKRLILGAIFVALPILVKFILTVALGGDMANICIF